MVVVVAVGIVALLAYMGLSSVSNVTIKNLVILDQEDKIMKDQYVCIGESGSNEFILKLSISSTGDNGGYSLYSTNPYVANVVVKNNTYVVEYYNSGKATIVAQSKAVATLKDSFDVFVYENYSSDLQFEDSDDENKKTIDVFADGLTHEYKFNLVGQSEELLQNSRLLRVVDGSYDTSIISSAKVNPQNNSLEIRANRYYDDNKNNEIVKNSNEYMIIQSGIRDANGDFIVSDNYIVKINIISNKIEDMQLVVSNDYGFNDDGTFVFSMLSDKNKVESTVDYENNEKLMRKIFLNNTVRSIYFKVRLVMSNGDLHYVTDRVTLNSGYGYTITKNSLTGEDAFATFTLSQINNVRVSFSATLIALPMSDFRENYSRTFTFIILSSDESDPTKFGDLEQSSLDISELYVFKDGVYTYSYYDARFKRADTITDKDGNIVGFTENTEGVSYIMHDEDKDNSGVVDGLVSSYEQKKPKV